MDRRKMLKVKLKALAAEARIIRFEEKRTRDDTLREELYLHRIRTVRVEARHTGLAYGFIRGRTYLQIEPNAERAPDWKHVQRMVEKYGDTNVVGNLSEWKPAKAA